jgi:hypothetical protein
MSLMNTSAQCCKLPQQHVHVLWGCVYVCVGVRKAFPQGFMQPDTHMHAMHPAQDGLDERDTTWQILTGSNGCT